MYPLRFKFVTKSRFCKTFIKRTFKKNRKTYGSLRQDFSKNYLKPFFLLFIINFLISRTSLKLLFKTFYLFMLLMINSRVSPMWPLYCYLLWPLNFSNSLQEGFKLRKRYIQRKKYTLF